MAFPQHQPFILQYCRVSWVRPAVMLINPSCCGFTLIGGLDLPHFLDVKGSVPFFSLSVNKEESK